MPFDPSTDPWGTAMLAAAALWALALLLVLTAWATKTSRRLGGRLMLLSAIGFLGAAVGGTRDRIIAADQAAAKADEPAPVPRKIVAPAPVPDPADGPATPAGGGETPVEDPGTKPADAEPAEAKPTEPEPAEPEPTEPEPAEPEPTEPEPAEPEPTEPPSGSAPQVAPLPTDPEERAKEIRATLRLAWQIADDRKRCNDLDEIANAWARLRQVPTEARWYARARGAAEDLEDCRRRLLYSENRKARRAQVDARDAFADGLAARLRADHDIRVAVSVSGNDHEKLRAGGTGMTPELADQLMGAALGREIKALAFAKVVLSDTRSPKTYEFETTPEHRLALPKFEAVGLGRPLKIERP